MALIIGQNGMGWLTFSSMEWLTLMAIVLGPIIGAAFAISLEGWRERRERRLNIFRTLMQTRRTPMWQEHVGALNLVEIEFHSDSKVMDAWKALFQHLGQPQPRHSNEEIHDGMSEDEKGKKNALWGQRINDERQKLLSRLLHAMGRSLGFKIEQLEIFDGGYTPQGWSDIELEQTAIRRLFADIYLGRRMFPIGVFHLPDQASPADESTNTQAAE